jgi:hypothetical protein
MKAVYEPRGGIMRHRWLLILICILGFAALGQDDSSAPDTVDTALRSVSDELARLSSELEALQSALGYAPLWDARGLVRQPRLSELMRAQAVETTSPSTPWQALPLGELAEQRWDDPGVALGELAQALALQQSLGKDTWELTQRLLRDGERATGALLVWGLKDDAIIGSDYRASFARNADGWQLVQLEQRFHCQRGVTESGLCL